MSLAAIQLTNDNIIRFTAFYKTKHPNQIEHKQLVGF